MGLSLKYFSKLVEIFYKLKYNSKIDIIQKKDYCFASMAALYINKYGNPSQEEIDLLEDIYSIFLNELEREQFRINPTIANQVYENDLIGLDYEVSGESFDRLITMDKNIKKYPELQEKYPILRLLFNGTIPKTYDEIISDRENLKKNKTLEEQEQIDALYNEIILLDPILSLTEKLRSGNLNLVREYLEAHPTLISEYPDEIRILNEEYNFISDLNTNSNGIKR